MSELEAIDDNNDSEVEDTKRGGIPQFMDSPAYMSPIVRRQLLQHMIKSLPPNSQRCVKALKNLQLEQLKMEAEFYEEIYQLQRKYQDMYEPLHDKRKKIVTGEYPPTDKEAEWKSDNEDEDTSENMKIITQEIKQKLNLNYPQDLKGIPKFWLTIFKNTELLADMIQAHDEEVLDKLIDIKIVHQEKPMSYILEFHFSPNDHFTNSILTKQYFMRTSINMEEPFLFEGPEIYKCIGCDINWNKGMNITVKTIKKKQKHKARNAVRTVTKQVPNDSFFNFFAPPDVPEDSSKVDMESQAILTTDFEIGHVLRERIIPKAVLYFTGDIVDDEDDDLDDEEDEDEEEEESDEEADQPATKNSNKNKKVNPADCPQQ